MLHGVPDVLTTLPGRRVQIVECERVQAGSPEPPALCSERPVRLRGESECAGDAYCVHVRDGGDRRDSDITTLLVVGAHGRRRGMADADVPDGVRAQLVAAASSDEPSIVEEALRVARPFATSSALEKDYAAATAARDRLSLEGTETARRLLQGGASNAEIQRAIIRFAPVLENAELQSLTRRLTVSLGSRGAAASAVTPPVIGRYRVVHKAVARAGFELTSAAVDVLQPGRTIEVVERRAVNTADDPQGLGIVRVRCTDGTWLSVSNRSGEPLIAELQGSPTLASPRSGSSSPNGRLRPPTPSEDGDTLFEHHADEQLGDAIRQHGWMAPADGAEAESETPRPQLRLVKSESDQLQPTLSLRDFEEMEELAERETGLRSDDHQRPDERHDLQQTETPNSPGLPTPIPVPLPKVSANDSADDGEPCETVSQPRADVDSNQRLLDASLAVCEVVISNCRLPSDTAHEVESLVQEQQERWAGLAASLLRAQVAGGTAVWGHEHSDSGWGASDLRLLVQHVQAYQKASLRGFLELTYALDEALKDSQAVASSPKVETVHALLDDSSYGRPLGLKFVHASDWARSGASAGGSGMVVKAVVEGGAVATACMALNPGAVLVGINEKNVGALSYGQTSALLKVAGQARPLQLTFKQLMSSRSHGSVLTGRASGVQLPQTPAALPLSVSERDSVLEVLRQHCCLPPSELVSVLAAHESDGYEALCERIAKVFGQDPRHQRQRQHSAGSAERGSPSPSVNEVETMKAELLSELEAQSVLNAEWAMKYEELEMEVSTLSAELAELRAENEGYRAHEAGTMSGRQHVVADAIESVTQAVTETLDRRALVLGDSRESISVPEAMAEWHALLDRSRTGWRSEARVAAAVSSLGLALEVTLSTIQQLGASLHEAEEEVVQLRGELASVIDNRRSDSFTVGDDTHPMAQSLDAARAEITTLRAQLARESSSYPGASSPTRRAAAEATEAAAAARAQVGTLRASLSQMVGEIDRLHLRASSLTSAAGEDSIRHRVDTPDRHGLPQLEIEEVGTSNTSTRADLAEVALSLRKLGEVSAAMSSSREELAANQRETAALQADLRDVRDGQAAAADMCTREEMAEKEAQIAELRAVRSLLSLSHGARASSLIDLSLACPCMQWRPQYPSASHQREIVVDCRWSSSWRLAGTAPRQ